MSSIVLKNGQIVDVKNEKLISADVKIESGFITEVGTNLTGDQVIDCAGKIVSPGLIDLHAHLREPGFEHKETIATATRAAAAGGFTTIFAMPNTEPPCDDEATAVYIRNRAANVGVVNVEPVGCISKGRKGTHLAEMGGLSRAKVKMVTDDGAPVSSAALLLRALKYSKAFGVLVANHCEDITLSKNGVCSEGYYSTLYGLYAIPKSAEETMVARDIILAREAGNRIHILHVSTSWSVELIRQAKANGVKVTCEVTPHHLTLTDELMGDYNTNWKVNPPLRSKEDIEAVRKGLLDGTIDCIATDHAPHAREDKEVEIDLAPPGISGFETAIGLLFTELVHKNIIEAPKLLAKMSYAPAKVVGMDEPAIEQGKIADITIIDPNLEWTVDPAKFFSLGKNTPLTGRTLKGKVVTTIVKGKVVFDGGNIL